MKRALIAFAMLVVLLLPAQALVAPRLAYAADPGYSIDQLTTDIYVETDSSMHVVEFTNNVKCFDPFGEEYPVRLPGGEVKMHKTCAWRDGLCIAGELDRTWALMRERGLVQTATYANATIIAYRPADFRTCYEEVLRGPDGCATCHIRPRHI